MVRNFYALATVLLTLLFSANSFAQMEKSVIDDFDFYMCEWEVKNKRQMDDGEWKEFDARVTVQKTLNGFGNVDFFYSTIDGEPFEGITVRTYDEQNDEWHIRWIDTDAPAQFPEPSIGKFENGEGEFYKTITVPSGREVMVRFLWTEIKETSFRWEAGWSIDGKTWTPTWKMEFKRIKDEDKTQ